MRGLDTNVLVRLVTRDDAAQAGRALRMIEACERRGETLHVSLPVLCELAWVLRGKSYGLDRTSISAALAAILDTAAFEIQERDATRAALADYREGSADFADYLIGHLDRRAGCTATLTFDSRLTGIEGFFALA